MRRLLPFILILLFIVLIVCIPLFLRLDSQRAKISAYLSRQLHHPVVVGKLDAVIFPPAIRLRDVNVMDPNGSTPILRAEQILAPISGKMLLRGQIAPHSLNIRGWTANLHRRSNGSWDWEEWLSPSANLGAKSGWPLDVISFDRGECHAIDPYGSAPGEFVIQVLQGAWERRRQYISVNGVFTSLPVPVSFLFQGSGRFLPEAQWTGMLGLSDENRQWKLECKTMAGRFQVNGQAQQWRFDTAYAFLRFYTRLPLPPLVASPSALLENWQNDFDWQGSTLTFRQTATLAGGQSEASGTIVVHPTDATARFDFGFQNVNLQPVETVLFGTAALEGSATGVAQFDVRLATAPWSALSGQGAIDIKDGKYFVPDASTRSLSKAHTMKYLLKKYPGFLGGGMPFKKAAARWQMRRGTVSFTGFSDLGNVKVALVGAYDAPRRGLDAYTRVQVVERSSEMLKTLPPTYLYKGEAGVQIQPMHGKVQGSPAEWQLRAIRPSKIPPAAMNNLSKTIRSK